MTSKLSIKSLIQRRKSPEQERAKHTVDAILEATAQLIEADDRASTNHIAERAGVSIGTVYQYFPNGASILAAIAERERDRIAAALQKDISRIEPGRPQEAIRAAIRSLLHAFGRRQKLRRKILLALLPVQSRKVEGQFLDEVGHRLLDILNRNSPDSYRDLDGTSVFVLTRAVMGAIRAAVIDETRDLSDPRLEDELVRLVCAFVLVVRAEANCR